MIGSVFQRTLGMSVGVKQHQALEFVLTGRKVRVKGTVGDSREWDMG